MNPRPTRREMHVLEAVIALGREHNWTPSLQEITEYVGLKGKGAVHAHLTGLQAKGYLTWEPRRPRSIRMLRLPEGFAAWLTDEMSPDELQWLIIFAVAAHARKTNDQATIRTIATALAQPQTDHRGAAA